MSASSENDDTDRAESKRSKRSKSIGKKKKPNFVALPPLEDEKPEVDTKSPSISSISPFPEVEETLTTTTFPFGIRPGGESIDLEPVESRAARRARGKSVYLTCFAGIDSIYFIVRLVIFIRVDIFHDDWQDKVKIATKSNSSDNPKTIASDHSEKYFCGNEGLEAQCAWIFSLTWLFYFLAIASLILSIIWLSLKLCYSYIFLKTTSVIINFLGLLIFGSHCLSAKFYFETAAFFVLHLPLQIFGTKRTKNYALSLKRAEMERIQDLIHPALSANIEQLPGGSPPQQKRSLVLQKRKSYQMVTTVDD